MSPPREVKIFSLSLRTFQEKVAEVATSNPNNLNQFRIKKHMRMAPVKRVTVDSESINKLDEHLDSIKNSAKLYLEELKERKPKKFPRTWPPGLFFDEYWYIQNLCPSDDGKDLLVDQKPNLK